MCTALLRPAQVLGSYIASASQVLVSALWRRYLPENASHEQARSLIKRSLTNPQYTPEGTERMAQAAAEAAFEDHLAAQEEAAKNDDPFDSLAEDGFDSSDIETTGYDELLISMRPRRPPNDEREYKRSAWLPDVVQIFWGFDSAR